MIKLLNKTDSLDVQIFLNLNDFTLLKDKIYIGFYGDIELEGLMIIDKSNEIKFYLENFKLYDRFLKYLMWNYADRDLMIKINKKDQLRYLVEKYKFKFEKSENDNLIFTRKNTKLIQLFAKD